MADIEGTVAVELTNNECVDVEMSGKPAVEEDAAKGLKRKLEEATPPAADEVKLNGTTEEKSENGSSNGHTEEGEKKNGHTNGSSATDEKKISD